MTTFLYVCLNAMYVPKPAQLATSNRERGGLTMLIAALLALQFWRLGSCGNHVGLQLKTGVRHGVAVPRHDVARETVQPMTKNAFHLPPLHFLLDFSSKFCQGSKKNGPVFGFQPILTRFWGSYCPKHGEKSLILIPSPQKSAQIAALCAQH